MTIIISTRYLPVTGSGVYTCCYYPNEHNSFVSSTKDNFYKPHQGQTIQKILCVQQIPRKQCSKINNAFTFSNFLLKKLHFVPRIIRWRVQHKLFLTSHVCSTHFFYHCWSIIVGQKNSCWSPGPSSCVNCVRIHHEFPFLVACLTTPNSVESFLAGAYSILIILILIVTTYFHPFILSRWSASFRYTIHALQRDTSWLAYTWE